MSRTVVSIEPVLGGGLYFKLRRATTRIDDALVGQEFHGSPEELAELAAADSATRIRIYGRALWDRLSEHQAVNAALTTVLGVPNGQVSPIYFELLDRRAERFHWETLCDNHDRFLALDRRWPIGRIAEPNRDLPSVRDFAPPLRVMAVLSALGARGEQEWNAILTAVRDSLGGPVPLRVHVLVSEPALYEQIRPLAAADVRDRPVDGGTHSWLSASVVPDRDVDLLREIDVFAPHVLHVFCHGSAAHEQPQLEFAAPLDWEDRPPTGSVVVTVDELANRPALTSMLLVVLNCCEGATPTQDVHSLAASLVANGLPAAVGMREPVDVLAAYEFSRSFYARLLPTLSERLGGSDQSPGELVEVDWALLMADPRGALAQQYGDPSARGEWSLPVLYVGPERLLIRKVGAGVGSVDRVLALLEAANAPPAAMDHVRRAIEQRVVTASGR